MNDREYRVVTNEHVYRVQVRRRHAFLFAWWGPWQDIGNWPDVPGVWCPFYFTDLSEARKKLREVSEADETKAMQWRPINRYDIERSKERWSQSR